MCEFTDFTEIVKLDVSNDNNLLIFFSRPVTFDRNISQLDLEITVLLKSQTYEFTRPLKFFVPDYIFDSMPLDSIPIEMLDIPFEYLNTGPEVRVRYMNTNMIQDINGKEIRYNSWGFTKMKRKFWNTNTKDRINTISSLGIMSNLGTISCFTLGTVTSIIT